MMVRHQSFLAYRFLSYDFHFMIYEVTHLVIGVCVDEFKEFFMQFGELKEHQIMRDHATGRSRGFGFVTYESEEMVDLLLAKGNRIELSGTQVT